MDLIKQRIKAKVHMGSIYMMILAGAVMYKMMVL
jgi:hypothetical protein